MPAVQNENQNQNATGSRTVVVDLARLIKDDKISATALSHIDKDLVSQAKDIASTLEDGFIDLQKLREGKENYFVPASPAPQKTASPRARPEVIAKAEPIVQPQPQAKAPSEPQTKTQPFSPSSGSPTTKATATYSVYTDARFNPTAVKKTAASSAATVSPVKSKFSNPIKIPVGFSAQDIPGSNIQEQTIIPQATNIIKTNQASAPQEKNNVSKLKQDLESELESVDAMPAGMEMSSTATLPAAKATPVKEDTIELPPKPLSRQEQLAEQEKTIARRVENATIEEKAALETVATSEAKIFENNEYFSAIVVKEKDFEMREADIRSREDAAVSLKERKAIEEERWAIEDERQKIEQERWQKGQQKKAIDAEISEKKKIAAELTKKKEEATAELDKVKTKRAAMQATADIVIYKDKLEEVQVAKKKGEADWKAQEQAGIKAKTDLEENAALRKKLNADIVTIEGEKKKTTSEEVRHIKEEERWKAETHLREVEKAGWQLEESLEGMETVKQTLLNKFAEFQVEEEALKKKITELQDIINKAN